MELGLVWFSQDELTIGSLGFWKAGKRDSRDGFVERGKGDR